MKPEEVDYRFGGMNLVNPAFRAIVATSLAKLPDDIVNWAAENVLFISS